MDENLYFLLADYEGFGRIVATAIAGVVGGCLAFGAVVASIVAFATGNRRHLWWTPLYALLGFGLFLAGVLVYRGP